MYTTNDKSRVKEAAVYKNDKMGRMDMSKTKEAVVTTNEKVRTGMSKTQDHLSRRALLSTRVEIEVGD